MFSIEKAEEAYKIKKKDYYPSIILIIPNKENDIIISHSKGVLKVYNFNTSFEEKLTITYNKEDFIDKYNEIIHLSLSNNENILITFESTIKCIKILKDKENKYSYIEIFSLALKIRKFCFYKCISLLTLPNQLVSCCTKEIIHAWIENSNHNNNMYRVKKVISVCNYDTKAHLLEIPKYKLLVSCSFKDKILKFFDLTKNYQLVSKINNIGRGYYEGCLSLINSDVFMVGGEGVDGLYLIDGKYRQIISKIELEGYKGWINSIYADVNYNNNHLENMFFYVGGEYEDIKKNFSYDIKQYNIVNKDINLFKEKNDVHNEKISSIILIASDSNQKALLCSASKLDIKIWKEK